LAGARIVEPPNKIVAADVFAWVLPVVRHRYVVQLVAVLVRFQPKPVWRVDRLVVVGDRQEVQPILMSVLESSRWQHLVAFMHVV